MNHSVKKRVLYKGSRLPSVSIKKSVLYKGSQLPSGYIELKYISNNVNGAAGLFQDINLPVNIAWNSIGRIVSKHTIEGSTTHSSIMFRPSSGGFIYLGVNQRQDTIISSGMTITKSSVDDEGFDVTLTCTDTGNVTLGGWTDSFWTNIYDYEKIDLYGTDNTTLLATLIPAKQVSDSAIGMYDTVNDAFYTSATSTSYVAGPAAGIVSVKKFIIAGPEI